MTPPEAYFLARKHLDLGELDKADALRSLMLPSDAKLMGEKIEKARDILIDNGRMS